MNGYITSFIIVFKNALATRLNKKMLKNFTHPRNARCKKQNKTQKHDYAPLLHFIEIQYNMHRNRMILTPRRLTWWLVDFETKRKWNNDAQIRSSTEDFNESNEYLKNLSISLSLSVYIYPPFCPLISGLLGLFAKWNNHP